MWLYVIYHILFSIYILPVVGARVNFRDNATVLRGLKVVACRVADNCSNIVPLMDAGQKGTGQVRCRTVQIQNRKDAGQDGISIRQMQDRTDIVQ